MGLKPSTAERAKFGYFSLGKRFNKGLDKDDKKEELFKRLKNIEDKNEEQLKLLSNVSNVSNVKEKQSTVLRNKMVHVVYQIHLVLIKSLNHCPAK